MTESNETNGNRPAEDLPSAPPIQGENAPAEPAPRQVEASFWLWIASAVVFVAGYAVVFFARGRIIDDTIKKNTNPSVTAEQIRSGTTTAFTILLVGSIVFAVLYILLAWRARQGTRSARTWLTVLIALTLIIQLLLGLGSIVTLLATLIGLVALVLLYLPKVAPFFPKVSRRRP